MNRKIHQVALTILATTVIGSAYAAESVENDALAIAGAKISLTQAVAAAEQHVGGKASRAEYEHEKGQSVFEVEVIKDKSVMDVKVDPMSGQVIASAEDKTDHNEDDEKDN
ncbi:MAG: PepSY domain-containing protein [Candidatus Competibacter sp.]